VTEYKYDDYWSRVGARYAKAVERALRVELGSARKDGRALDLGCGTGRWTRWLDRAWTRPIGVDISQGMLSAADPMHPYVLTDVTQLRTFEFALSVTVLLHLPQDAQMQAMREVARVLAPGGTFLMLEMVNRVAERTHVFPHPVPEWRRMLEDAGFAVRRTDGEAFAPLLRLAFAAASRGSSPRPDDSGTDAMKSGAAHSSAIAGLPGPAKLAARAAVAASYPLEYALSPVLPDSIGLNVCIVASKPG
jgi:SAM-dependent methyltransferase